MKKGSWVWQKNIPDPNVYSVKQWVTDDLVGKCVGEPRSQGLFSVPELKKRDFVGVYVWQEAKEAQA